MRKDYTYIIISILFFVCLFSTYLGLRIDDFVSWVFNYELFEDKRAYDIAWSLRVAALMGIIMIRKGF